MSVIEALPQGQTDEEIFHALINGLRGEQRGPSTLEEITEMGRNGNLYMAGPAEVRQIEHPRPEGLPPAQTWRELMDARRDKLAIQHAEERIRKAGFYGTYFGARRAE